MLESAIEQSAAAKAKGRGWRSVKVGFSGHPDRIFWQRNTYAWVEFKRPGNTPTKLQAHRIKELKDAGEHVTVAHSADECLAFLDGLAWWLNDHGL